MPLPTPAQRHKVSTDPLIDPHVTLLEFYEDASDNVVRAAINSEDVVWQGNTYTRSSIDVRHVVTGGGDTRANLVAENVSRLLGRALDSVKGRLTVRMIVIDVAAPDTVVVDTRNLIVIGDAQITPQSVSAEMVPRATLLEPVTLRTTKDEFPGAWLA